MHLILSLLFLFFFLFFSHKQSYHHNKKKGNTKSEAKKDGLFEITTFCRYHYREHFFFIIFLVRNVYKQSILIMIFFCTLLLMAFKCIYKVFFFQWREKSCTNLWNVDQTKQQKKGLFFLLACISFFSSFLKSKCSDKNSFVNQFLIDKI